MAQELAFPQQWDKMGEEQQINWLLANTKMSRIAAEHFVSFLFAGSDVVVAKG